MKSYLTPIECSLLPDISLQTIELRGIWYQENMLDLHSVTIRNVPLSTPALLAARGDISGAGQHYRTGLIMKL